MFHIWCCYCCGHVMPNGIISNYHDGFGKWFIIYSAQSCYKNWLIVYYKLTAVKIESKHSCVFVMKIPLKFSSSRCRPFTWLYLLRTWFFPIHCKLCTDRILPPRDWSRLWFYYAKFVYLWITQTSHVMAISYANIQVHDPSFSAVNRVSHAHSVLHFCVIAPVCYVK